MLHLVHASVDTQPVFTGSLSTVREEDLSVHAVAGPLTVWRSVTSKSRSNLSAKPSHAVV